MGCRSSKQAKSTAATEPVVSAPKTLLTTDAYSTGDCRDLSAYAAEVAKASESEVRAAVADLPVAEQKKLADALGQIESGRTVSKSQELLDFYVAQASAASERDVEAALQGLALADRTRLVDALSSFPRVDIELSASDAGNIFSVNASAGKGGSFHETMLDGEVQVSNGAMEATSASSMPTATAESPQASSWMSCCHAQSVGTTEFVA